MADRKSPASGRLKILDRYLLRQYVQVFIICYVSLTGLYIVFHAFTNLDEFARYADKHGNLLVLLGEFYAYHGVFFFDRVSGILALIAAMFTMSWIQRHHELTAILAAGIPVRRVIVPIVAAATTVSLGGAFCREVVIPRFHQKLARNPKDLAGDIAQEIEPCYDQQTDLLIRGQGSYGNERRIHKPNFLLPLSLPEVASGALPTDELIARDAYYRPAQSGRPAGYWLRGVSQPQTLLAGPSLHLGGRPFIITPRDAPGWLGPDECFVASEVTFEQLTGRQGWRLYSSTLQLIRGLRNPSFDFGADIRVAIHCRLVRPLLDMTLLFIGLPLVVARENRKMLVATGLCVVIVSAFLSVVIGCQQLGEMYLLAPALAAWLPVLLFVPIAVRVSEPLWS